MTRRRTMGVAVPLLLALALLGGCAGDEDAPPVATAGGDTGASATPKPVDDADQGRKFAACMRAEGVDMPDPDSEGRIRMKAEGAGVSGKKSDAGAQLAEKALEKCRDLMPDGGEPPKMSPEDIEKMRTYAACVRKNGYPAFPDPDPATGELKMGVPSPADGAKMNKAVAKCEGVAPGALPAVRTDP
jgi:hypothetical protein